MSNNTKKDKELHVMTYNLLNILIWWDCTKTEIWKTWGEVQLFIFVVLRSVRQNTEQQQQNRFTSASTSLQENIQLLKAHHRTIGRFGMNRNVMKS